MSKPTCYYKDEYRRPSPLSRFGTGTVRARTMTEQGCTAIKNNLTDLSGLI